MSTPLDQKVEVPLYAVVYAAEYGMGRMTYANSDTARLTMQFWHLMPEHIKSLLRDNYDFKKRMGMTKHDALPWAFMFDEED